ncbi:uncharacterized protein Dana_GF19150 [Drosophila ananassae]|uniref:Chitin-binding type-2 domain-containing protein n=1 Tax=Drosophila ananassae TaxID=7217 RepID=B3MZC7_DROAN|nr:uncharacterized protein Dana_GF19150 [Drosophila ananassae]
MFKGYGLRQPTTANVSRRPVLSVRRRIINSPASTLAATATASEATRTQIVELPATTSKYSRLRSKLPTVATTIASAAAATTNMPTTTSPTSSNSYLSKLKAKAAAAAAFSETATLTPMSGSGSSSNDVTQKQHKFQPASFALRRQFQTRRLTTFAPATNADESGQICPQARAVSLPMYASTEIPRTQNPLFKRRLTLISTSPPSVRTTNVPLALETTTSLYPNEDDEDQVAKSSIHTSRFNQIPDQVKHRSTFDLSPVGSSSTDTTTQAPQAQPLSGINTAIRRQLIPRPRRPQSTAATVTPTTAQPTSASTASKGGHSAPPLSRRQQSRRRPHKYIEVYSRPPSNPGAVVTATLAHKGEQGEELSGMGVESYQVAQRRRSDNVGTTKTTKTSKTRRISTKAPEEPKVIVHGRGIIECRAQGNFPHPLNCRKFISCARFEETGGIVGWEYTCPKGLTYNGVGGMCTWSPAEQVCRD